MREFVLTAILLAANAWAASVPFGAAMQRFMPPALGDARMGCERSALCPETATMFDVRLPPGEHHDLTVCAWFRICSAATKGYYLTTAALYAPEAVRTSNPSLAFADVQGWPTNMTLAGTVSVDAFAFAPYAPGTASNTWPRGVYTVAGWSSNAVTVALGGADVALGPGAFCRNVVPGSGAACTVTGTGAASVGVSRCPAVQWFGMLDGVRDVVSGMLTADSVVTNEISFCVWRLRLDNTAHIYRSDLARVDRASCQGQTVTNAMPERVRAFSSQGIYRVGFMGLGNGGSYTIDMFDCRVFTRLLSDDECCRIHANGIDEIFRRGIPRWR